MIPVDVYIPFCGTISRASLASTVQQFISNVLQHSAKMPELRSSYSAASTFGDPVNALDPPCPLLRLSPELRDQVYEYVFGGNIIHVYDQDIIDRRRNRWKVARAGLCQLHEAEESDELVALISGQHYQGVRS